MLTVDSSLQWVFFYFSMKDRNLIDETATDLSVMPYIDGSIDDENTPTLEPQTPIDRVAPGNCFL